MRAGATDGRGVSLTQVVQCGSEASSQLLCRARSPVMQEIDCRLRSGHVVMDRYHVQAIRAKCFEHRSDLLCSHGNIASNLSVCIAAVEGSPGIQAHARIDRGAHFFELQIPREVGDEPIYENLTVQGTPVRFATSRVVVNGHPYTIQVAAPLQEFNEALERFRLILWLVAPLLLIGAGLGGYLISRRALNPVDRITAAAESISISNLSDRLEVPKTSDELQRLSETLNRMLSRLNSAVQRISQFTADASHELRAPISLIRATAELAVHHKRTNDEYHEDMVQILAESERTSKLIDSLLLLARADAGGAELQHELTDVSTSVREATDQARTLAAHKRIEMATELDGPVVVHGDGEALRRLSFILVDNAIKYSPEGGRVQVGLRALDGKAVITVSDSGIGISESDLPHIFDRFWRADKVRSRATGGAGLGLSIARWIVDEHHGTIEVESKSGQGSTFSARMPLARVDSPAR